MKLEQIEFTQELLETTFSGPQPSEEVMREASKRLAGYLDRELEKLLFGLSCENVHGRAFLVSDPDRPGTLYQVIPKTCPKCCGILCSEHIGL